jgi:hypothetical protein
MRSLTGATLQRTARAPDTPEVAELIVFGPALVGGAIVVFFGRRLLARAGLRPGVARATAVLAGVAAAATWGVFLFDSLFYALGENGPEYYEFSTYMEYRDAVNEWPLFIPAALGYALLTTGLALGAAVVWRRFHPSAGIAVAAAACVAVLLPAIVPSRLSRVEYGKDPVLYTGPENAGKIEPVRGRPAVCIGYGVQGIYAPGTPAPPPERLCIPVQRDAIRTSPNGNTYFDLNTFHEVVHELNEAGIHPPSKPTGFEFDGLELDRAQWIAG